MISQCCIKSLYDDDNQVDIRLAKSMERRRCGHVEKPETPFDCVMECVGSRNKNRYIVATQDVRLREKLRNVPGVPLVYINRSVMILEPPSPATTHVKEEREKSKIGLSREEAIVLGKRKRGPSEDVSGARRVEAAHVGGEDESSDESGNDSPAQPEESEAMEKKKKKRKGPSGPNPLSAKKSKSKSNPASTSEPKLEPLLAKVVGETEASDGVARSRRKRKHKKKVGQDEATSEVAGPPEE
jgi:U3 small nucleolar RNA-associated protein 23